MSENRAQEFAEACGATEAVDLRIQRADGLLLAEGELDLPCAVVGRDPACEVVLADPDVAHRHAFLQVIGGRVFVADLGSRTGVRGAVGGDGYAWLTPTGETRVGPFRLFLRNPVSVAPAPLDRLPNPFQPNPDLVRRLPRTVVRFLNGRADRGEWAVNRLVAMVGRSPACKVNLAAADVADQHCYFLLTPAGLWVVDLLSPTGTWVNGEAVRIARLRSADEVRIGPFLLGVAYPDGEPRSPATEAPTGFRLPNAKVPGRRPAAPAAEPTAPPAPARTPDPPLARPDSATLLVGPGPSARPAPPGLLGGAVEALHRGMADQQRQTVAVIADRIDRLPPDRLDAARQVVARLADLNADLARLQGVLLGPDRPADAPTLFEEMAVLQDERHGLWQKLLGAAADLI